MATRAVRSYRRRDGERAEASTMDVRDTERIETMIVGDGQAGLAAGYHLARRDRRS